MSKILLSRFGVFVLFITILIGVSGCMKESNNNDSKPNSIAEKRAKLAEKMLNKKYGKEFVAYSVGNSWGTMNEDTFTALCYEKSSPTLRFEAEIDKDGTYMFDEYVSRNVSEKIESKIQSQLENSPFKIAVKVGAGVTNIDSNQYDMSVEEFIKLVPTSSFAIYIVIEKQDLSIDEARILVEQLSTSVKEFTTLNGAMDIYVGKESMLDDFNKYNKENPNADSGMFDTVKEAKNGLYQIEGGKLQLSAEQIKNLFS